ncbi:hypothetical protein PF003_g3987 [Phytophthora fragariae]|nr:hypothetical protein PF003_g3987 [Phytophthora fragariae]
MTSTSSPDTGGHDRPPRSLRGKERGHDPKTATRRGGRSATNESNCGFKWTTQNGTQSTGTARPTPGACDDTIGRTRGASDDSLGGGGRSPRDGTHSIGSAGTSKDGASELCYGSSPRSGQHGSGGYINADGGGRNVEPETASHPSPDTS